MYTHKKPKSELGIIKVQYFIKLIKIHYHYYHKCWNNIFMLCWNDYFAQIMIRCLYIFFKLIFSLKYYFKISVVDIFLLY
jgi:hypothetical protein